MGPSEAKFREDHGSEGEEGRQTRRGRVVRAIKYLIAQMMQPGFRGQSASI